MPILAVLVVLFIATCDTAPDVARIVLGLLLICLLFPSLKNIWRPRQSGK